jgi:hypothetical protein
MGEKEQTIAIAGAVLDIAYAQADLAKNGRALEQYADAIASSIKELDKPEIAQEQA